MAIQDYRILASKNVFDLEVNNTSTFSNYLSWLAGKALVESGTVGSITTTSTNGTTVGAYTNTYQSLAPGGHPDPTVIETTTTLYQNVDISSAQITSSDIKPVKAETNGDIKPLSISEMKSLGKDLLTNILSQGYDGAFYLSASQPVGYVKYIDIVFTDTRSDGTSLDYHIWRKENSTSPTSDLLRTAKIANTFDIQHMTEAEMKAILAKACRYYIASTISENPSEVPVGGYLLIPSTSSVPVTGTWVGAGNAINTVLDASDVDYTRTSTRNSLTDFSLDYSGQYIGDFIGEYSRVRSSTFTGNYIANYIGEYTGVYTGEADYTIDSTFYYNNLGLPTSTYNGYIGATSTYTRISIATSVVVGASYSGSARKTYYEGLSYTGDYVGTNLQTYARVRTTPGYSAVAYGNYDGTSKTLFGPTYGRATYASYYTGGEAIDYLGNFIGNYIGDDPLSPYEGTYVTDSTTDILKDFVGEFTGNYEGAYTSNYDGNYIGNYVGDFIGDYVGNYLGLTVQTTFTTTIYNLYVRTN